MTLSVQSSAGPFHSAQGYPAIHALLPSGLITAQLQPFFQATFDKGQNVAHQTVSGRSFLGFMQRENHNKMNMVVSRYTVEVMWK